MSKFPDSKLGRRSLEIKGISSQLKTIKIVQNREEAFNCRGFPNSNREEKALILREFPSSNREGKTPITT